MFSATALRHPAGIGGRNNGAFVPNHVRLGGVVEEGEQGEEMAEQQGGEGEGQGGAQAAGQPRPPFILLSGPNMGGKSTLLRQTCLATIMAQVRG